MPSFNLSLHSGFNNAPGPRRRPPGGSADRFATRLGRIAGHRHAGAAAEGARTFLVVRALLGVASVASTLTILRFFLFRH
jgi:hypothetical protein